MSGVRLGLWASVLVLSGFSSASAQVSFTLGNPYAGGSSVVVGSQPPGLVYPGYGYPAYGYTGYNAAGYPGYAAYPGQGTMNYNSVYATGFAPTTLATTSYAPIVTRQIYAPGAYYRPLPPRYVAPGYMYRPAPMRPFGRPAYYYR